MIKYLVIDVDGTMTDAGIYYDEYGNELKKFCTKDAVGFFASQKAGIKLIVLTGRECKATKKRMKELKVDYIFQNVKDKFSFLDEFIKKNNIDSSEIGYIGDDLNDLRPMRLVEFIGCPADACEEIKSIANYVSSVCGGHGAVRDIIEQYFRSLGLWENIVNELYRSGV